MGSPQPNLESFLVAGRKVFYDWTALSLAVEHGWGGRDGRKKRDEFFQNVMETIAEKNWDPEKPDHVMQVADGLDDFLVNQFNTNCEDMSHEIVAKLLLDLCARAKRGDYSLAEQVMTIQAAGVNACKGKDESNYLNPVTGEIERNDGDISELDASDDDMAEVNDPSSSSAAPQQMFDADGNYIGAPVETKKKEKEVVEVQIDEDGFETVPSKGRRRR